MDHCIWYQVIEHILYERVGEDIGPGRDIVHDTNRTKMAFWNASVDQRIDILLGRGFYTDILVCFGELDRGLDRLYPERF